MSKTACALVALLHLAAPALCLFGQQLENVSVRRSSPSTQGARSETATEIAYLGSGIRALIMKAYGVRANQIVGPVGMDAERYDVIASLPPGTDPTSRPLLLRSLLEERFALKLRIETSDKRIQALVAKDGLKAPPVVDRQHQERLVIDHLPDGTLLKASTLNNLAAGLSTLLHTTVVDKTHIAGRYKLDVLLTSSDVKGSEPHPGNSVPTQQESNFEPSAALQNSLRKLGLTLTAQEEPVTTLIVEHFAFPAGNEGRRDFGDRHDADRERGGQQEDPAKTRLVAQKITLR